MLHANCTVVCVINRTHCRAKFYLAGIGISDLCSCDLDLDSMTFIHEPDLYSLEIQRMCECELPTSRLSKVLSSDRHKDIHTYERTDTQTKLYTTPLRGWLIKQKFKNTESLTLYFKINLYSFRLFTVYYIIIILDFKMGTTGLVVYHFREFTRTVLANFEGNSCQKN